MAKKIRISNIILLTAFFLFFVTFFILMFSARAGIKKNLERGTQTSQSGQTLPPVDEKGAVLYSLDHFNTLNIAGEWNVSLESGDSFTVYVDYGDDNTPGNISVSVKGDSLILDNPDNQLKPAVMIILPELKKVIFSGSGELAIKGFSGDSLVLETNGNPVVKGENSSFKEIVLKSGGSSNLQLDQLRTENLQVDLTGNARVQASINGGKLSGQLSGKSILVWSGSVLSDKLRVSSGARVSQF